METNHDPDEDHELLPLRKRGRGRPRRPERDIFGDEYLGARRVLRLSLDEERLPEGARKLVSLLSALQADETFNPESIFSEALQEVDPEFWQRKLEELSPLEWKLVQALKDDVFRERVRALLEASPRLP